MAENWDFLNGVVSNASSGNANGDSNSGSGEWAFLDSVAGGANGNEDGARKLEGRELGFMERHALEAESATGREFGEVEGLANSVVPFYGTGNRIWAGKRQKGLDKALESGEVPWGIEGALTGMDDLVADWDKKEGAKYDLFQRALKGDTDADYSPIYAHKFSPKTGTYPVEKDENGVPYLDTKYSGSKEEARKAYVRELAGLQVEDKARTVRNAQEQIEGDTSGFWKNLAYGATSSLGFAGEFALGGIVAKGMLGTAALRGTALGKVAQAAQAGKKLAFGARTALTSAEIAAPTMANALARYENLTADEYRMDDDGNVYLAEKADGAIRGAAKALGGAAFENATEVALGSVVNKMFGATCKGIYRKVPGVKKLFDKTLSKVGDAKIDAAKKAWVGLAKTYSDVQKAVHFELLPVGEFAEEYVQGYGDEVLGFDVRASGETKGAGDFTRDFFDWNAGGKDLFFGVMGQTIALGIGGHTIRRARDFKNSYDGRVRGTLKEHGFSDADIRGLGINRRIALANDLSGGKATADMAYSIADYARFAGVKESEIEKFGADVETSNEFFAANRGKTQAEIAAELAKPENRKYAEAIIGANQFSAVILSTATMTEKGVDGATAGLDMMNAKMKKAVMLMQERQGLGNYLNNKGTKPTDFQSRIDWSASSDANGNINWKRDDSGVYIESAPLSKDGFGVRIYREGDKFRVVHPDSANSNGYVVDNLKEAHDYAASLDQFAQKRDKDRDIMREYVKFNAQRLVPTQKDKKTGKTIGAPVVTANNAQDALENLDWLTEKDIEALQAAMADGTEGGGYTTSDGTVIMLLDNLADPNDALLTLAHELGGHAALAEGADAKGLSLVDTIKEAFKGSKRKDVGQYKAERRIRMAEGEDAESATEAAREEAMVYGNEYKMPVASPLQKAKTAVKTWLKAHGMDVKMTDADLDAIAAAGLRRIEQTRTGDTNSTKVDGRGIDVTPTAQGTDLQNRYEYGKWVSDYYAQREQLDAARAALDAADAARRNAEAAAKEQAKVDRAVADEEERQKRLAEEEQMRKDAEYATAHGREMVQAVLEGWYGKRDIKPEQIARIVNGATTEEVREILDYIELEMDGKASEGAVLEIAKRINADIAKRTVSDKQKAQREAFAKRSAQERKARAKERNALLAKYIETVQMNPNSALAFWLENGGRLFVKPPYGVRVANKGKGKGFKFKWSGGLDAEQFNDFFEGIHAEERKRLEKLIFGDPKERHSYQRNIKGEMVAGNDSMLERWIEFKRGVNTTDYTERASNEDVMNDEDFQNYGNVLERFMKEYNEFREWAAGDRLSAEEQYLKEQYEEALQEEREAMDAENAEIAEAMENWGGAVAMTVDGKPVNDVSDIVVGCVADVGKGEYSEQMEVVGREGDVIKFVNRENPLMDGDVFSYRWNKERGDWEYVTTETDEGGKDGDRGQDTGVAEQPRQEGEVRDAGAVGGESRGNGTAAEAPSDYSKGEVKESSFEKTYRQYNDSGMDDDGRYIGIGDIRIALAESVSEISDEDAKKAAERALAEYETDYEEYLADGKRDFTNPDENFMEKADVIYSLLGKSKRPKLRLDRGTAKEIAAEAPSADTEGKVSIPIAIHEPRHGYGWYTRPDGISDDTLAKIDKLATEKYDKYSNPTEVGIVEIDGHKIAYKFQSVSNWDDVGRGGRYLQAAFIDGIKGFDADKFFAQESMKPKKGDKDNSATLALTSAVPAQSLTLDGGTAKEIAAEEKRIADRAEIERRMAAPLKTGVGEVGQSLMDLGGAEGEDLFNRTAVENDDGKSSSVEYAFKREQKQKNPAKSLDEAKRILEHIKSLKYPSSQQLQRMHDLDKIVSSNKDLFNRTGKWRRENGISESAHRSLGPNFDRLLAIAQSKDTPQGKWRRAKDEGFGTRTMDEYVAALRADRFADGETRKAGAQSIVYRVGDKVVKFRDAEDFDGAEMEKVARHNELFPDTAYTVKDIVDADGKRRIVLEQPYIDIVPNSGTEARKQLVAALQERFGADNVKTSGDIGEKNLLAPKSWFRIDAGPWHIEDLKDLNLGIDRTDGKVKVWDAEIAYDAEKDAEGKAQGRWRRASKEESARLNNEPTIKVFRAIQVIDGKLYPPMAAKVDGKLVDDAKLGEWLIADERPDLAKNGKFTLNKGNGSSIAAAYNPYWHTSRSPLNDQFSSAYKRPNLVTVEVEVPVSELSSGYKADHAKDAVGEMSWHSGPVSSKLAKMGMERKVILSRYCKPIRVVDDAEVADTIAKMLKDKDISIPGNVITPSLRAELEQRGVNVERDAQGRWRRSAVTPAEDAAYMDAVKRGDMEAAQDMVNDRIESLGGVFHRGKDPRITTDIVQWADDPNQILSYGERQYAHLPNQLVEIPKYVFDFAREYFGDEYTNEQIEEGVNPKRIVDAALAWDDRGFVSELWNRYSTELEELADNGIAGFKTNDGAVSFPQGPGGNMFKSADPVTYDDAGNVIPLSERFNSDNADIRWRRRYTPDPAAQSIADQRIRSLTDILRDTKFGADNAALFAAERLARELAQQGSVDPITRDLIERTQTGSAVDRAKGISSAIFSKQNLSQWRERMQDSLISLREMEDRLGIRKDASAYYQFDRNFGKIAKAAEDLDREIVAPLAKELHDNNISNADFSMLLMALHGAERNRMIAERSPYVRAALNDPKSAPYVNAILAGGIDVDEAQIDEICKRMGWTDKNGIRTKEGKRFAKDLAGSGATTAYWNGKIDGFKRSGMFAKAQKAVDLVRELTRRNRQLLVDTGRLSAAQANLWEKLSPNYVPLRSDMEMDGNVWSRWFLGVGKDKDGSGGKRYSDNEYNHAYGRGTLADTPLEFAIQQYHESLQRAYDNVARQRLAELVRQNPNLGKVFRYEPRMTPTKRAHYAKSIAIIRNMIKAGTATADDIRKLNWYQEAFNADTAIPTIRVLGANGVVHEMPNIAGLEGTKDAPTGVVAFKEDGELKFIKLGGFEQDDVNSDPSKLDDVSARRIATAVKKQNMAQLNGFGRTMRKLTGWFSALRTAYSPTFMVSNLGADNTQAARNIYATFGVGAVGKFEHYAFHAFKAARAVIANSFDNTKIQQYAKEWYENGGKIGGMAVSNISDLTDQIKRTMRKLNSQKQQLMNVNSLGDLKKWLGDKASDLSALAEKWNGVVEMSTRIAAYATVRDMGMSVEDAVSYSRDITVNFNRKGTLTPWLNAMYAFSNATMQDLHRSLVAFGEGRIGTGAMILAGRGAKMGIGLMMMGFIASMFGFWQDDPEDEKDGKAQWKYAKDWEKQNTLGVRVGEKVYGVPIRGISRVPYYLGHQVYEAITGRKNVAKAAADTLALAASNTADFMGQASSPLMTAVPSVARDPIDIFISNKTFTGRQRYREPLPGQENTAVKSEMGRKGTSEAAVAVARALNWISGGDKGKPGAFDMQPEKIQGVWEWLFGSAGKDMSNFVGTAKDVATLNIGNRELRNIPYASRFARNLAENSADYYESRNRYEIAKKHYEQMAALGDERKMREDVADYPWLSSRGDGKRWGIVLKDLDGAVKKLMEAEKAASPEEYDAVHQLRLKTQYQFMRRLMTPPQEDAEGVQDEREHKRAYAPLLRSSKLDKKREQREVNKRKRMPGM